MKEGLMTLDGHKKWRRHWLLKARKEMRRRDWLRASDCFRSAAFHDHILKIFKETKGIH